MDRLSHLHLTVAGNSQRDGIPQPVLVLRQTNSTGASFHRTSNIQLPQISRKFLPVQIINNTCLVKIARSTLLIRTSSVHLQMRVKDSTPYPESAPDRRRTCLLITCNLIILKQDRRVQTTCLLITCSLIILKQDRKVQTQLLGERMSRADRKKPKLRSPSTITVSPSINNQRTHHHGNNNQLTTKQNGTLAPQRNRK